MASAIYETLQVTYPSDGIALVVIHRPRKLNAMNLKFFEEIGKCFQDINVNSDVKVVIFGSSLEQLFTAGLDLVDAQAGMLPEESDVGRKGLKIMSSLKQWQESFNKIEECRVPVICVVNGPCIGGGVDLISAMDIRICTSDAYFSVKEVDIGMAPDLGTLQRLPKIIGSQSFIREWCLTGRKISSAEAFATGLVSHVAQTKKEAMDYALKLAQSIASKSPVATTGIKYTLNYARDHSVKDGLVQIAMWNGSMLQSSDLMEAITATMSKSKPRFNKL